VDELGRRSYITSIAYDPSLGKNTALGYLPYNYCQGGRKLAMAYFNERYSIKVEAVAYGAFYHPENARRGSVDERSVPSRRVLPRGVVGLRVCGSQ
jgi:glycine cleavage system aminomethyltransferase T